MYAYFICEKCNIDFDKIATLKGQLTDKQKKQIKEEKKGTLIDRANKLVDKFDEIASKPKYSAIDLKRFVPRTLGNTNIVYNKNASMVGGAGPFDASVPPPVRMLNKRINKSRNVEKMPCALKLRDEPGIMTMDPDDFSGKAVVTLTESPNYNLYGWGSRTYEIEGNIRTMINTGFHSKEVWVSVLFQILAALYTLQIHHIYFSDFTLEDNIYVKDIAMHSNITRYWKYKIDGIEYFVPNYGYLVLFDSNFKDIQNDNYTISKTLGSNKKYKLFSNIFQGDSKIHYDEDKIHQLCFDSFKKCFNNNSFSKAFTNVGGTKPPEPILHLIDKIYNEADSTKNTNIGHYIYKCMRNLMNNRIGTYLTDLETPNIRKDDHSEFYKGKMIVCEVRFDTYKFALFLKYNSNGEALILTKEDKKDDIIEKTVGKGNLFNYAIHEKIVQNFKPHEANLNEEDMLETYNISIS